MLERTPVQSSDAHPAHRGSAPRSSAVPRRAKAHAAASFGAQGLLWAAGTALLLSGCSGGETSGAARQESSSPSENAARIAELIEAYEPVDPVATSDVHDVALQRQREVLEELRKGDRGLGLSALAAFRANQDKPDNLRAALLEVAAVCDPEGTADVLEPMVLTYDPHLGLGLRTRAAELLAETSPERALALIEPLVLEERPQMTLPPREALVRAWATAAHRAGREEVRVLADVAVNIAQPPDARYAAIGELGKFGGRLSALALEEVLFEAVSDAYLRRKAAQALQMCLPPAELCPILERAAAHEHDEMFLRFLGDLMSRNCP